MLEKAEGGPASHIGGDGMHSKNYQPDSFHLPRLVMYLSTFFADTYVNSYVVKM